MKLADNLFNWLQIHLVCLRFPEDEAAKETEDFFYRMLQEDHMVREVRWELLEDGDTYVVEYQDNNGKQGNARFDRLFVEKFLTDLEQEPRYRQ